MAGLSWSMSPLLKQQLIAFSVGRGLGKAGAAFTMVPAYSYLGHEAWTDAEARVPWCTPREPSDSQEKQCGDLAAQAEKLQMQAIQHVGH